eukprot:m.148985 g.148985  ORF g.148985 m.148985 type:complete len:337 (+) comp14197_c0_seq4:455-1465(+)
MASSVSCGRRVVAVSSDESEPKKQPAIIQWQHLDKWRFYTVAPLTGLATRVILFPTQLVKTRLQVQKHTSLYNGTFDAFRKIVKFEGVRGLYKGFLPNTVSVLGGQLYITCYESIKSKTEPIIRNHFARNFFAGGVASMISQVVIVPINVVSQRMMVHGQSISATAPRATPLSMTALISSIVKQEGWLGFYKGYGASVAAFAPTSGLWWATYDIVRRWQSKSDVVDQGTGTLSQQALGGATAGIATAFITNPLDVIRARLQVDGRRGDGLSFTRVTKMLFAEEGWRGFYKGVTARMMYMGINSVMMIGCYETVKRISLRSDLNFNEESGMGADTTS